MGDPVTMAMIGAGVGAITNPRKPLQGALLGGALGGFGGAAATGFKAAGSAGTAGLAGGGGSGMFTAGTQVANPMAAGGTYFSAGTPAAAGSLQAGGNAVMNVGQTAIGTSPTFMEQMRGGLQGIGQFNRENPMVGQVGSSAFQSLNEPQPMAAAAPPGLLRGNPIPVEQQQMAMLQQPQITLI
jgi:hypothetical protein